MICTKITSSYFFQLYFRVPLIEKYTGCKLAVTPRVVGSIYMMKNMLKMCYEQADCGSYSYVMTYW